MRVVSLVPSWTEFLHDLDVNVVGQTKFCVRPQTAFRTLPRVGGTKTVKIDAVLDLNVWSWRTVRRTTENKSRP